MAWYLLAHLSSPHAARSAGPAGHAAVHVTQTLARALARLALRDAEPEAPAAAAAAPPAPADMRAAGLPSDYFYQKQRARWEQQKRGVDFEYRSPVRSPVAAGEEPDFSNDDRSGLDFLLDVDPMEWARQFIKTQPGIIGV